MQSTGEVVGIHADGRVAMAKALRAASLRPPLPDGAGGVALLSIADRDKDRLGALAAALVEAGYRLAATQGTAAALRRLGHRPDEVARIGDGAGARPSMLQTIRSGAVTVVVNTPSPVAGSVNDGAAIRVTAAEEGILCLTSIDTAIAAARSLRPQTHVGMADVAPLEHWQALAAAGRRSVRAA
jgi:carbamoyl-phosphate synthase large subunit